MSDKKNSKCLMLKTKDQRKFFTHEKNYLQLLEFSKLFKAEISIVSVKEAEVLELEELAPAICNAGYVQPEPTELKVIEVKLSQDSRNRQTILKVAKQITDFIEKKFKLGDVVSLKILAKKFKGSKVTTACLCNHLTKTRNRLEKQGYKFLKLGGGKYKMEIIS